MWKIIYSRMGTLVRTIWQKILALFIGLLGILNLYEGVDHGLDAFLQIWGMTDLGVFDWRFLLPAVKAVFWALVSLATFLKLREKHAPPTVSCPKCGTEVAAPRR